MQSSRNSLAPAVPRRLTVLSVLTLIGFGANIYLTQLFYQLRGGTAGFKSICNLNSSMNCDAIAASRWAEFLFGIPLSSLAAGWLLGLFFVSLFARNPFWRRDTIRAALGMTVVSCVLSVVYFFIMAAVIKSFCLFCLVVDVINFATLGILLSLKPESFSLHKPDTGKFKNFGGILVACLLVVVIGMKLTDSQGIKSHHKKLQNLFWVY